MKTIYILIILSTLSYAENYWYIGKKGADTNIGSKQKPFKTFEKALSVLQDNDSIIVKSGEYVLKNKIKITKNNITIKAEGKRGLYKLKASIHDKRISSVIIFDHHVKGGKVEGLEIEGGFYYGIMFHSTWERNKKGASDIVVKNCTIHDTGRDGIKCAAGTKNIQILGCHIYNTGKRDDTNAEGIDAVNSDNIVIRGNYIHDTATTGMYMKGSTENGLMENNLIRNAGANGIALGYGTDGVYFDEDLKYESIDAIVRNNIVINTGMSKNKKVGGKGHHGIYIMASLRPQIYNNTVVNAGYGGDSPEAAPLALARAVVYGRPNLVSHNKDVKIVNNIFYQEKGHGGRSVGKLTRMVILNSNLEGKTEIDHNCWFNENGKVTFIGWDKSINRVAEFKDWKKRGYDLNSMVDINPNFIQFNTSENQFDVHLQQDSPVIGKGTEVDLKLIDYDGGRRGAKIDMGADQFGKNALELLPNIGEKGTGLNI